MSQNNSRRLRIAQHGAVYGRNFGDVLIQVLLARKLTASLNADVFFPRGTREFAVDSQQKVGGLWRLPFADAVVFGPGGYLGERRYGQKAWNRRLQRYHGQMFKGAKLFRRPLFVFGAGVGPLSDPKSRALVRDILDYASFIQLRDEASAEYAAEMGIDRSRISVVPDIALSLDPASLPEANLARARETLGPMTQPVVGLHLPVSTSFEGANAETLRQDALALVKSQQDITFVLLFDSPTQKLPSGFEQSLLTQPNVVKTYYTNPDDLLAAISLCSHVVTTKLHVGICATALCVNPIGIYFHPKVVRFYSQIARGDFCHDMAGYGSGWLQDAVVRIQKLDPESIVRITAQTRAEVESSFEALTAAIVSGTGQ